jgi:hypothetical protein
MSDLAPRTTAELLTEQFYQWELRGRGWQLWDAPVELEPPFRPFFGHHLPTHRFVDDGQEPTALSVLGAKVKALLGSSGPPVVCDHEPDIVEPGPGYVSAVARLTELQVVLPPDYEPLPNVFEQFLFSVSYCRSPLTFEVIGTKDELIAQMVAGREDASQVQAQLKAHFSEAVIIPAERYLDERWAQLDGSHTVILEFGLESEFMLPLSTRYFATDPLVGITGALEALSPAELGLFQIIFTPTRNRWAESVVRAVTTGQGDPFFENAPELVPQTKIKLLRPIYAVVLRVAVRSFTADRAWQIVRNLAGALRLFANPQGNELIPLQNGGYDEDEYARDLVNRLTRRSGMLLNTDELVALAHLPSAAVKSRKLKRETKKTKAAPDLARKDGLILGENEHAGEHRRVGQSPEQRVRHTHVIGASGTGKSTLLLNMIVQDIHDGQGVGLLDPHGDLMEQVLDHIPKERWNDVVIVDPSDEEFPVGFNILAANSELEKNLLASDLVAVFQRLSSSWGDQMTSVLGNAILAFLESPKGGTLADLRRFLIEQSFRKEFLITVQDPEVVYYWQKSFPLVGNRTLGPLLTRLDTFLRPKAIRYMVAQRENKLNFGEIMDRGKIFLAKLPQGLIGEDNSYLLGSLLVSKFQQQAMSRQAQQAAARRDFWLYVDEFHHFVTPSMASILTGARKYRLGLILAHQEIRQLHLMPEVASAVVANPYTRICFRLGDDDAKRLADGFSSFEPQDFLNLGTGEAIVRMERADYDFNLRVRPLAPAEEADSARQGLYDLSREKYSLPRGQVEQMLAQSRQEPERVSERPELESQPAQMKASPVVDSSEGVFEKVEGQICHKSSVLLPPVGAGAAVKVGSKRNRMESEVPLLGRGGPQHKYLQHLIKELAIGMGFEVDVEKTILDGAGSVDVELRRGDKRFAFEISITTPVDHEIENIQKCIKAGYDDIIIVCLETSRAEKLREAAVEALPDLDPAKCRFCTQQDFSTLLIEFAARAESRDVVSHGKKTRVTYKALTPEESEKRRALLARISTQSLKKMKRAGPGK